ncbi:MAG TPA: APC family permease [Solirubrobacteraceae bacterium]|nr:APC family permease [Solirubrobacteraceae bacterium]
MEAATVAAGTRRAEPEPDQLKRAISRNMLLLFVVGDVLGAGIYALVGTIGDRVGGAIWASFVVAIVLAFFTAVAYAELVTKYPRAAGAALYVNKAFGIRFLTFMVAFAVMCSGLTSAATLSRAFAGDYLAEFVSLPTILVACGLLLAVAAINSRGIGESVKVNVGFTLIELTGLVLVVVIGLAAVLDGAGDTGRAFEIKEGESLIPAVMAGAGLAFYAMIGFEDSVNVAEEAREPQRDYPRALFGGLLIAGAVYLAVSIVASMAVPTQMLAESDGPLLEVVQVGPLAMNTQVFAAIALFAVTNGALINMIMASRLLYGMSIQGIVPGGFSRVLPGRRTPWVAIAFTTLLAMVLVSTGDLSTLADMTVLLLLGVFALVNTAVLVLRRDRVDHQHYHAPTLLPVLGVGISIAVMFTKEGDVFLRAGLLLLVGVVFWVMNLAALRARGRFSTEELARVQSPPER